MRYSPDSMCWAHSEEEVDAYRFIAEKSCENQERFDKGQLMVMNADDTLGYDFFMRMIGADGEPVNLFFVTESQTDGDYNTIENARFKYDMLVGQFRNEAKYLGKHALVYLALKDFKASKQEIKEADFPLIVFPKANIIKLIGPSLGFLVPLRVHPKHRVPPRYFTM